MGVLFCRIDSPDGGDILESKPFSVKSVKTIGTDCQWELQCRYPPGHSVAHYPVLSPCRVWSEVDQVRGGRVRLSRVPFPCDVRIENRALSFAARERIFLIPIPSLPLSRS
jgi:hypothetical protein